MQSSLRSPRLKVTRSMPRSATKASIASTKARVMGSISAEQGAEETRGTAGALEGGLVHVQVQAVDGLDLEDDMPSEGVGGGACYSHGADYGRRTPRRRHDTVTVALATIRRLRSQSRAATATRTGFAGEDSSA